MELNKSDKLIERTTGTIKDMKEAEKIDPMLS
jgi:hypothetical protein